MDWQRRAAGETEAEISQPSVSEQPKSEERDYLVGVIEFLETFTQKKLNDLEASAWMARLSKYPRWKLGKLVDYTGGLDNRVFEYLDSLRRPETMPEYLRQLPEANSDVGKRTIAYLDVIYSDAAANVKDQAEREWVEFMRSRGHNFVRCQRKGNLTPKRC